MTYFGSTDYARECAAGRIPGCAASSAIGFDTNITTAATKELVWSHTANWVAPTAARIHSIVSTSASDTNAGGAGMRQVLASGLDAAGSEQSEVVALNGITPVNTVNSYIRLHLQPVSQGSAQTNVGVITATAQTDGTVTAQMPAGTGIGNIAQYSVPAGKTALIYSVFASLNNDAGGSTNIFVEVDLMVRLNITSANPVRFLASRITIASRGTSNVFYPLNLPTPFPPLTDLFATARATATSTAATVGFNFEVADL